jgi:hypothetical protein
MAIAAIDFLALAVSCETLELTRLGPTVEIIVINPTAADHTANEKKNIIIFHRGFELQINLKYNSLDPSI